MREADLNHLSLKYQHFRPSHPNPPINNGRRETIIHNLETGYTPPVKTPPTTERNLKNTPANPSSKTVAIQ
jgi:hypothetical protein